MGKKLNFIRQKRKICLFGSDFLGFGNSAIFTKLEFYRNVECDFLQLYSTL